MTLSGIVFLKFVLPGGILGVWSSYGAREGCGWAAGQSERERQFLPASTSGTPHLELLLKTQSTKIMKILHFIALSSSFICCFCFSASFNSSLNSSHFPLSIPRPLLPYFQSVSKASKRQPRQELTNKVDKESAKSDFEVDSDTKGELNFKVENLGLQENLGLRVPPTVREHYMKGRSGRQIVPGVYSCGHQVPTTLISLSQSSNTFSRGATSSSTSSTRITQGTYWKT